MNNKNVILVGLGPHANRIYLKFIKEHEVNLKIVVDIESQKKKVEDFLLKKDIKVSEIYYVPDKYRDDNKLPLNVKKDLIEKIKKYNITHAIISTEPKAHFAYAMFFIQNGISVLMDKPITAPINVINDINQAKKITDEYNTLCEEYKKYNAIYKNLIFSIQCQRRFHKGYIYIKEILSEVVKKYKIPISYIDIYHCDGMWNMPDELIFRENHPYKYGYGKLFHSGYHFIDLLSWLLEINNMQEYKTINNASVYAESYNPSDFVYNFNNFDYNNILKTNKFEDVLKIEKYNNYGELDIHSIINFYHDDNVVTNCTLNLMQSGFSRRAWPDLPIDTYKSNGRVRHERINIQVGPLMNIQIHSYQAYETKERDKNGGNDVGQLEHFDIYIFRNSDLIGGKPFELIKLSDIDSTTDNFIGYNEKAREICFLDFINDKSNDSNILNHKSSIMLTEAIYNSLIVQGGKIKMNFDIKKDINLENIDIITDKDFNIKEKINDEEPIIRFGARGIVIDENENIAIINKQSKNEYKLPGGGIEDLENAKQAFERECIEEIGCEIEIEKCMGTIEEYKSQENFKQLSFIYIARKKTQLSSNNLTKKEKEEKTRVLWLTKLEALEKMKYSLDNLKDSKYDNVYRTRFMVLRDIKILEKYLNN